MASRALQGVPRDHAILSARRRTIRQSPLLHSTARYHAATFFSSGSGGGVSMHASGATSTTLLCARRWCATTTTTSGTRAEMTTASDKDASTNGEARSAVAHGAMSTSESSRPEDSPFANFHRQRSSTSRRWEWESPETSEATNHAARGPASASEPAMTSISDTCTMPSTDTAAPPRPAANTTPSSSSPGTGEVRRMSLTIRSPQQRVQERRAKAEAVTAADSTAPTSETRTGHTSAHAETNAEVLRRRAAGTASASEEPNQVPSHLLRSGASYAAANPKNFNTRLTIQSQRGIARFTEPVKRIVLLRNGVSEANEDISAYVRTPDWRIPLTEEGRLQCVESGRQLADLVGDEPVYFYYSPYIRSRQSLRYVLEGYDQRRLETLQGAASERLQWWEKDDQNADSTSRAVAEATSGPNMQIAAAHHHRPHAVPPQQQQQQQPARETRGEGVVDTETTLASLSSDFTTTGTVGASSTLLSPAANREAAVAAAEAAMRNEGEVPEAEDVPARSSAAPRGAGISTSPNHVLPTGPSLVLRSGTLNHIIGVREDVRLRDGDIGRYGDLDALLYHLREREQYGRFFYRFPYGESGADVCDRVTSFLDAFQRERVDFPMDTNVVIITHGLTIRMFIKRWFHLTVDTFHRMQSPPSASLSTLTRLHHQSSFRLDEACVDLMTLPQSLNEHNGYKYRNKRLLGSMSTGAPYM